MQPLVENSIMHGIFNREDKKGIICISGRKDNGDIILRIKDNGIGIRREKLADIFNGGSGAVRSGFGIKNIDDRIKLKYGPNYGLTYNSRPGDYTEVVIKLPVVGNSEEMS